MLRLLHTADVHLGARHTDLGDRASIQRERQYTAFRTAVDLAISEAVDLVLVAGDLFDSNTQPRRSVERVGAELGRLARASIRTVLIPGTHDVYDGASIYRAYDLAAIARAGGDWIAVLTPERPEVVFASLDAVVYARVFATKKAPRSPLLGLDTKGDTRATWRLGMVHGALAIPGRTDADDVVFTEQEIAATGLDYLALGHWHSTLEGRAGTVTYAYSGAPEPVAVDQDGAGQVLLVTLDDRGGRHQVTIEPRRVGQTRCESLDLDVSGIHSQPDLIAVLMRLADPNLILDVKLSGLFPDDLDMDLDEVERTLGASFLRFRLRDMSIPGLADEPLAPPETVLGAFVRTVQARITELETLGGATAPLLAVAPVEEDEAYEAPAAPAPSLEPAPEEPVAAAEGALETTAGPASEPAAEQTAEPASEPAAEPAPDENLVAAPAADASPIEADGEAAAVEAPQLEAAPVEAPEPPVEAPPGAPAPEALEPAGVTVLTPAGPAFLTAQQLEELADLREVLRLGRHLLEGRQVTL